MRKVAEACLTGMLMLCSHRTPASAAQPALALHDCRLEHPLHVSSAAARCATLQVLLDRGHPDAGKIGLRLAVVPALNRRSGAAPLFLLAGGPGQGAADMYVALAAAFARINRDHDIVLVDQRGTGRSDPLNCAYPEDWRQPPDPLPQLRKITADCLARLGDRVRFFTSSIAVQDLDEARAALGYGQIDIYGASYGTRVAQLYMRRFAGRVHAVILDGVTYPEQIIGPDTPADADRALHLIVARCQAAADCAAAYPGLERELTQLLEQFGAQKIAVTVDDPNSAEPQPLEFSRVFLSSALRSLSYSAAQAALLPVLIHHAAHGALGPLAAQTIMSSRQVGEQLSSGMQYSVLCTEDVPFFGAAGVDRAALGKTFAGVEQLDALQEVCTSWPRGPMDADLHQPLHSDIPTLLLSGEADPVTPPAAAERAALGLARHRHLVLSGEGHGQLTVSCVPRLMAQFLLAADPAGLDAGCLQQHRVEPFFVSMNGPSP